MKNVQNREKNFQNALQDAVSILKRHLSSGQYDEIVKIDQAIYNTFAKSIEKSEAYEAVFASTDELMASYGDIIAASLPKKTGPAQERICYLLPSLDNDLAHIETLYNLLNEHPRHHDIEIFIAGPVSSGGIPASRMIKKLYSAGKIKIIQFPNTHKGFVDFLSYLITEQFAQLIVFSIPLLLSAIVRALGPEKVTWLTTKFELAAFNELAHRTALFSWKREILNISGKLWQRSLGAFSAGSIPDFNPYWTQDIRLVSVNRPEKIRHRVFLDTIADILLARPRTSFSWTGRTEDSQIAGYFAERNLSERVHFIGWVDFPSVIRNFDLFVDSPNLSGSIAARAAAAGMPTLSWRGANSWIELFERPISDHLACGGHKIKLDDLLFSNRKSYALRALALIDDAAEFMRHSVAQKQVCSECFCDTRGMYHEHMEVVKEFIAESQC